MLYAKALRDGLSRLPGRRHRALAAQHRGGAPGWPALHARLAEIDPASAARIGPNDAQRIQRALEVYEADRHAAVRAAGGTAAGRVQLPVIALLPEDRARLHTRIEQRFDAMLAAGFLDEVRALRDARRPRSRPAGAAQRRLPPGLGAPDAGHAARAAARRGRGRDAPARQAADHVAAVDERCRHARSIRGRPAAATAATGRAARPRPAPPPLGGRGRPDAAAPDGYLAVISRAQSTLGDRAGRREPCT